jgi:hypothetical protein
VEAGIYSILLGSSSGATFSNASLTAIVGGLDSTVFALHNFPDNTNLKLDPTNLSAGTYRFDFAGDTTGSTSFTGNVRIAAAAVPEPATWAMMIIGFASVGLTMRRRRRPVLAQLA